MMGLKNNYEPESHSFSSLLDEDRHLAQILAASGFLEVYLARLTRKVEGELEYDPDNDMDEGEWVEYRRRHQSGLSMGEVISTEQTASNWVSLSNSSSQFHGIDIDKQVCFMGSVRI